MSATQRRLRALTLASGWVFLTAAVLACGFVAGVTAYARQVGDGTAVDWRTLGTATLLAVWGAVLVRHPGLVSP